MADERRRQKRMRFDSPVYIGSIDQNGRITNRVKSPGQLSDLSAGGCAFVHKQIFTVGDRLELKILLNEALSKKYNQKELIVRGEIIRISNTKDGFMNSVRLVIDR